jgi:hypothetical protein
MQGGASGTRLLGTHHRHSATAAGAAGLQLSRCRPARFQRRSFRGERSALSSFEPPEAISNSPRRCHVTTRLPRSRLRTSAVTERRRHQEPTDTIVEEMKQQKGP